MYQFCKASEARRAKYEGGVVHSPCKKMNRKKFGSPEAAGFIGRQPSSNRQSCRRVSI